MPDLLRRLESADARLRRTVARVRKESSVAEAPPATPAPRPEHLKAAHKETALDQSMAALQAVVWIASFVQSIFNEIRGRGEE
ncbi:MAG: hypothetical protein ACAI43_27075 [Phycisphaerae bacterium]|nr:hypothetical protein [Tepidisphaeraceae bacterium]